MESKVISCISGISYVMMLLRYLRMKSDTFTHKFNPDPLLVKARKQGLWPKPVVCRDCGLVEIALHHHHRKADDEDFEPEDPEMAGDRTLPKPAVNREIGEHEFVPSGYMHGICEMCGLPDIVGKHPRKAKGPGRPRKVDAAQPEVDAAPVAVGGPRAGKSAGAEKLLQILIDQDLLSRVDDFRYSKRFESRATAIRWLLDWALAQAPEVGR
jgi:hypothetical protein